MQAQKVGIREFRERLSSFIDVADPVAVTRHGETIGFFIPVRARRKASELEALRTAAALLDAQITAAGIGEDDLLHDFKEEGRH